MLFHLLIILIYLIIFKSLSLLSADNFCEVVINLRHVFPADLHKGVAEGGSSTAAHTSRTFLSFI